MVSFMDISLALVRRSYENELTPIFMLCSSLVSLLGSETDIVGPDDRGMDRAGESTCIAPVPPSSVMTHAAAMDPADTPGIVAGSVEPNGGQRCPCPTTDPFGPRDVEPCPTGWGKRRHESGLGRGRRKPPRVRISELLAPQAGQSSQLAGQRGVQGIGSFRLTAPDP